MQWSPVFESSVGPDGRKTYRVGHELVDEFLEFASVRCRPSTVRAYAHDLKMFFGFVGKEPAEVTPKDVLAFIVGQQRSRSRCRQRGADQRRPVGPVVGHGQAPAGGGVEPSSATWSSEATRSDGQPGPPGDAHPTEPAPRPTGCPARRGRATAAPDPDADEVELLMSSFRTDRDRAMAQAMLLGGLRRCEVLGLRLEDLRVGERQLFIAEGKGGHQRLVPISPTFFATVADYLNPERPPDAPTDRLFVALKGPRRGHRCRTEGLDEVFSAARARAGLVHGTCHELRHTCFTRLKEAGMAIEAIQALAGHRSIASTRIYLHLGGDWLANEYRRAAEAIDAQAQRGGGPMSALAASLPRRARASRSIGHVAAARRSPGPRLPSVRP